jgi:hypothetical protein
MTRRIKKPPVLPEQRQDWLRRSEEGGTSPPKIAEADGFDVRTVRKHIEIAKQEKEVREARSIVLRNALERHYEDLCNFAQKLDAQVPNEAGSITSLKEDRMWEALHQHLPRSVLWNNFSKREQLLDAIMQSEHKLQQSVEQQIKSRSSPKFTTLPEEVGFDKKSIDAIVTNVRLVAQEKQGLLGFTDFELIPDDEGLSIIQLGSFRIGKFLNEQVPEIEELMRNLLDEATRWPDCDEMRRSFSGLDRIQGILRDELAVITLRRVVPGRCRYCPI